MNLAGGQLLDYFFHSEQAKKLLAMISSVLVGFSVGFFVEVLYVLALDYLLPADVREGWLPIANLFVVIFCACLAAVFWYFRSAETRISASDKRLFSIVFSIMLAFAYAWFAFVTAGKYRIISDIIYSTMWFVLSMGLYMVALLIVDKFYSPRLDGSEKEVTQIHKMKNLLFSLLIGHAVYLTSFLVLNRLDAAIVSFLDEVINLGGYEVYQLLFYYMPIFGAGLFAGYANFKASIPQQRKLNLLVWVVSFGVLKAMRFVDSDDAEVPWGWGYFILFCCVTLIGVFVAYAFGMKHNRKMAS